jgi:serine/threonine-protein kinase RsbW
MVGMPIEIFPGRYDSLEKIADFVKGEAQKAGFDTDDVCCIETAVDEACSNIIEHAYGGENIGTIECSASMLSGGIRIRLRDQGKPFRAKKYKPPNLKGPLRSRKTHGLGLYFIYKLMDTVEFSNDGTNNTLVLVRYRKDSPDATHSEVKCNG